MRVKNLIFIGLLGLLVVGNSSCNEDEPTPECGDYAVVSQVRYNSAPDDDFTFDAVTLEGNCLSITIQYGGGCEEVNTELIDEGSINYSNTIGRNIRLSLHDTDNCEALVTTTLKFDLTPLQVEGENQIILNMKDWNGGLVYDY